MVKKPIRIVIVDDEVLLAQMLKVWVAHQPDFILVGMAEDGEAGWDLCVATQPDLALLDIEMPKLDGLELVERLRAKSPEIRLLAMSGLMDPYTIWRVIQSGVHGYIDKTQPPESLTQAIRIVAGGGTYFSPVFKKVKDEWLSQPESFQKILSEREQGILRRVVIGRDDAEIGLELGISPATVEAHRKHIRQKLGLHNDRGLMAYAQIWGLNTASQQLSPKR
jgi:DNA-binding NarL/FixJ family response regulator